jgi:hypothetical protein
MAVDNLRALNQSGLHNFKRSINNNFFQWLPGHFDDNQVRRLLDFFHDRPSMLPLSVRINILQARRWHLDPVLVSARVEVCRSTGIAK